jgi:cell division protein ZapE
MGQHLQAIYDTRVAEGMLRPDPVQRAALLRFEELREKLEAPERKGLLSRFRRAEPAGKQGLYLWGGVGRGKSMLMDLFFAHVGIEAKRRVHFHAFMQEVQAALHEARKTGVDDAIKPVAERIASDLRLLCFDEMQITDIADAMIVGRLFEKLFDAGVVIVTTSNRPPRDLYKDGLNRNLFRAVHRPARSQAGGRRAGGDDRLPAGPAGRKPRLFLASRQGGGARAERDLARPDPWPGGGIGPGGQGTRRAFAALLGRHGALHLLGAVRPTAGACRLPVAGGGGETPGAGGYPAARLEKFNEAKRFVTLIDALYEGHVRLICSAEAEPEKLYLEGAGSFEFERTASRLREMQGADWGSGRQM